MSWGSLVNNNLKNKILMRDSLDFLAAGIVFIATALIGVYSFSMVDSTWMVDAPMILKLIMTVVLTSIAMVVLFFILIFAAAVVSILSKHKRDNKSKTNTNV